MQSKFNAGGPRGKNDEGPADGPARVVKSGDWGAVAETAMKGFQMAAFSLPGRVQPKPDPAETKIAEMARENRRLQETHKQALQKAAKDAEDAARSAHARGREEGLQEGEKRAGDAYAKALDQLRAHTAQALDALSGEKASLFLEFEGQVLELVSSLIHRVFEGFAAEHSEAVLPLLKKAVAALGQAANITLKVNPTDFQTVSGHQDFWLPVDASPKDVRIVPDDRIPKGGCLVESDSTSVSMQADTLAERVDEELKRIFTAKAQALKAQAPAEASDAEGAVP